MAGKPTAKYFITAEDKSKSGINSAKGGLGSLGDKAKAISGKMIGALAAVGVSIAGITKLIKESITAFAEQEKVEIRLAVAAKNNPLLSGKSYKNLKQFATQMQNTSIFGDEQIIQMEAFLASQGRTEQQIKDTISAAVDLASVTGMSLDSAVRNLSKTYGGLAGELGETIPALRELTQEELKSGKAVELISEMYGGAGEAISQGLGGQLAQLKNLWGDTLEKLGSSLAPIILKLTKALKPTLDDISKWIADNADKITNFFLHLPQIINLSFKLIGDLLKDFFNIENIIKSIGIIFDWIKNSIMHTFTSIYKYLAAIGTSIWEPIKFGFEWIVHKIKIAWQHLVSFIIDAINVMLTPINAVIEGLENTINAAIFAMNFLNPVGDFLEKVKFEPIKIQKGEPPKIEPGPEWNDVAEKISTAWVKAGEGYITNIKSQWENMKSTFGKLGQPFSETIDDFITQMDEILNQELPENLRSAAEEYAEQIGEATGVDEESEGPGIWGDFGEAVQPMIDAFAGGFKDVKGLWEFIVKLAMELKFVKNILGTVSKLLKVLSDILTPVVDKILAPLMGFLVLIVNMLGHILIPIFEILAPILQLVSYGLLFLYNYAIRPIANAIIFVANIIYNIAAAIFNAISFVLAMITFGLVQMGSMSYRSLTEGTLEEVSMESMTDMSGYGDTEETESSTGVGASYTGGTDVNIAGIYIYTDVITGDGGFDELALKISDAIERGQELGYST